MPDFNLFPYYKKTRHEEDQESWNNFPVGELPMVVTSEDEIIMSEARAKKTEEFLEYADEFRREEFDMLKKCYVNQRKLAEWYKKVREESEELMYEAAKEKQNYIDRLKAEEERRRAAEKALESPKKGKTDRKGSKERKKKKK